MKKAIKLAAILICGMIMLTGCMFHSEVQVNKNGSADIAYTIAVTSEEMEMLKDSGYTRADVIQPEGINEVSGIETKIYEPEGFIGNTYTQHKDNIQDVNLTEIFGSSSIIVTPYDEEYATKDTLAPQFTIKENFFVKKIILDANLDLSKAGYGDIGIEQDYKLKISSKGSIKNTNATNKGRGYCEWELNFDAYDAENPSSANPLKATICFYNPLAVTLIVLIIAAAIGAGTFCFIKYGLKNMKK